MGTLGRPGLAASIFQRFLDACLRADDERFVLGLCRLAEAVTSTTELDAIVAEILADGERWWTDHFQQEDRLRADMVEFRQKLTLDYPGIAAAVAAKGSLPQNFITKEFSLERFDRISGERILESLTLMPERFENSMCSAQLLQILRVVANTPPDPEDKEEVFRARQRVEEFGDQVEWLHRERINSIRMSAFSVWIEVVRVVERINPRPEPSLGEFDIQQAFKKAIESMFRVPIEKVLYEAGRDYRNMTPEELKGYRAWRSDIEYRLAAFRDEVLLRLDMRGAADISLRRYAARSMWHRRQALVDMIDAAEAKGVGHERLLVADAAAYLFDQGFNVETEVTLGTTRLDLLRTDRERPLLIEAKVYKTGSGKPELVQGLRQLHDYTTRLATGLRPVESCLLLFRLGGTRLALPEDIEFAGCSLRIVPIDLSDAQHGGSKAPAAVGMSAEEIVHAIEDPNRGVG